MLEIKTKEIDLDVKLNGVVYHGKDLPSKELEKLQSNTSIDGVLEFIGKVWNIPEDVLNQLTTSQVLDFANYYKEQVLNQKKA
ncbi:MAG: hypothetical protein FWE37_03040 [Spirochaetaceae bacterium]|nr:hypothetical protein [Spirochaetaceae bacterium]